MQNNAFTFYEFFAGAGMVRQGLGPTWQCLFANDFDPKKAATYKRNWGKAEFQEGDIRNIACEELPGKADLAWASFPCQDLSLAGNYQGLKGARSGTFWPFWQLMHELHGKNRAPEFIVLENVCGALTSHQGKDFIAICASLQQLGYRVGAVVMDAVHFLPQSRPRLFIIGAAGNLSIPHQVMATTPSPPWNTSAIERAFNMLPTEMQQHWTWWHMPQPPTRRLRLIDLIEPNPESVSWHSAEETEKILNMMSEVNRSKVDYAQQLDHLVVGAVYRRTRSNAKGEKVQRAEIRMDGIAGCLRTPSGGSSRQILLFIEGSKIKSRLISSRETARLMGLPDTYKLPENYNEAYHLTGDGVAAPVVRHIAGHLIEPVFEFNRSISKGVA